jgi:hypothetical protein
MGSFDEADVETAVRVLRKIAELQGQGDMRAVPQFSGNPNADLYTALKMVTQEPAVEAIIWDPRQGQYFLAKREPGQTDFGIGREHIFGGFMKPVGTDISPAA